RTGGTDQGHPVDHAEHGDVSGSRQLEGELPVVEPHDDAGTGRDGGGKGRLRRRLAWAAAPQDRTACHEAGAREAPHGSSSANIRVSEGEARAVSPADPPVAGAKASSIRRFENRTRRVCSAGQASSPRQQEQPERKVENASLTQCGSSARR